MFKIRQNPKWVSKDEQIEASYNKCRKNTIIWTCIKIIIIKLIDVECPIFKNSNSDFHARMLADKFLLQKDPCKLCYQY